MVVDIGYESSRIVPFHNGDVYRLNAERIGIGGRHITDYLVGLLKADSQVFVFFQSTVRVQIGGQYIDQLIIFVN